MSGRNIVLSSTTLTSPLTIPADGEDVDSASVELGLRPVAQGVMKSQDRLSSLESTVPGAIIGGPIYTIRPGIKFGHFVSAASFVGFGGKAFLQSSAVGAQAWFNIDGNLPQVGHIKFAQVWIQPAAGHAALPGTMPTISVQQFPQQVGDQIDCSPEITATGTDLSANVTDYQKAHTLVVALDMPINNTKLYQVVINFESGANAAGGCSISSLLLNVG